jgi:hypothetical protein
MREVLAHERLRISREEFDALMWVREELASGRLRHVYPDGRYGEHGVGAFNMAEWSDADSDCGTVCCVGGWMSKKMQLSNWQEVKLSSNKVLAPLFFPNYLEAPQYVEMLAAKKVWLDITPTQAVQAIDNFVENGDPRWAEILEAA